MDGEKYCMSSPVNLNFTINTISYQWITYNCHGVVCHNLNRLQKIALLWHIITSSIIHVLSCLFLTKYAEDKINTFDSTNVFCTTTQTYFLGVKLDKTKGFTCWEENSGGKDETPWSLHPVLSCLLEQTDCLWLTLTTACNSGNSKILYTHPSTHTQYSHLKAQTHINRHTYTPTHTNTRTNTT